MKTKSLSVTNTLGFFFAARAIAACAVAPSTDELGGSEREDKIKDKDTKPATGNDNKSSNAPTADAGTKPPTTTPPKTPSSVPDSGPVTTPPVTTDGGTAAAGMCAAETTQQACWTCCDPTHAEDASFKAFDDCACGTPGTCKTECGANYCNGQAPTAACDTCLNGATQCAQATEAACNAACQAAFKCEADSQCQTKTP